MQIGKRGLFLSDRRRNTTEIKTVKQTAADEILKMIDSYDAKRRLLDATIQEANHTIEIDWPKK
jgi:RES domain-containing protein